MDLANLRVRLPLVGKDGLVEVNGTDLTAHVRATGLVARRDELPVLQLEVDGEVEIEGQGVVHVAPAGAADVDEGALVAAWLANIDAELLGKAAMERMDWGEDSDVVVQSLAVLREWAEGKS